MTFILPTCDGPMNDSKVYGNRRLMKSALKNLLKEGHTKANMLVGSLCTSLYPRTIKRIQTK